MAELGLGFRPAQVAAAVLVVGRSARAGSVDWAGAGLAAGLGAVAEAGWDSAADILSFRPLVAAEAGAAAVGPGRASGVEGQAALAGVKACGVPPPVGLAAATVTASTE